MFQPVPAILTLILLNTCVACTPTPAKDKLSVARPLVAASSGDHQQKVGIATYYGADFAGLPMADGRLFDPDDATIAASNRWPLGTRLRLTRIAGGPGDAFLSESDFTYYLGRTVVVTVEDRGAFHHALDLSRAAFARLGPPGEGVIAVQIEILT
ncbi:MAG: septal ring lytic transglycosylase RlpA family protein [Dehalococcoidia bacterium]